MKILCIFFTVFICMSCKNTGETKNTGAYLSSLVLVVDGEECEIRPSFNSNQFEYEATCYGDNVSRLGYTISSKIRVQSVVKTPLDVVIGKQELSMKVIAEDGSYNEYIGKNGKSYYFTKGDSASGSTFHVWKEEYINSLQTPDKDAPVWNKIREQADTYCVYNGYCDRGLDFLPTGVVSTKEVGTKKSNYLDIHDMSGNVCERCFIYTTIDEQNFNIDTIRGGSWDSYPRLLRIGHEAWARNYSSCNHGFRLARTIK